MVDKIRDSYQKHSRNISSISDISVSASVEPLKRDVNAEIRCVFLTDSETERRGVFDAVSKNLSDGQSEISNFSIMYHHWEQPHFPCEGSDCRYCLRNINGKGSLLVGGNDLTDGAFFRFSIGSTIFRLMLLSKDKQNLLKIITFDFVFVGIQVTDARGNLEESIWEFEWKRLERLSKKAVSPLIIIGYFRDIHKLTSRNGNGSNGNINEEIASNISIEKTLTESRNVVRKAGKFHKAIPRFVDFVTGTSSQFESLFREIDKLYKHPGYILRQCALINNLTHWTKILENPELTFDDLKYSEGDDMADNALMIAAKLRHKDLVSAVLRSNRLSEECNTLILSELIHLRNCSGQTLLAMVALQGPELEEQKLLILRTEIQVHCVSDITHEADQLKLQRCLRGQLKSSAEAAIILEQSRALQGIPKTQRELKAERGKVWSRLFFASLLLSIIFNAIDTGSDVLIMIRYYRELMGETINRLNSTCGEESDSLRISKIVRNCNISSREPISIQCLPSALSPESKFGYTLFFLLVPWPFFIYEFFTSRHYNNLIDTWGVVVNEMSNCSNFSTVIKSYLKAIVLCFSFVFCVLLWPIAVLFIKYYNDGKYYLAKGAQRAAREKKIETSEVLYSTARVMEVSLESSFQPTIQLYIIFPVLMRTMTAQSFSLRIFTVCKMDNLNFPMLKPDQTISIITSILSLAWCFTFYHATLKRGALDKDLAALFYRAVLFLSVLFQIIGRLFILVLFSYSFGPGMYFPVLIFLAVHILLMTILHFIFSDAQIYWLKGGFLNLSFFHYMIGNGLANIYIHNWIRMDPLLIPFTKPLQHVSTFIRQLIFDIIFVSENVVLLVIALTSDIKELQENRVTFAVVLLGFTLVGLILKCVYYRYLHIWAWLIMDYITKKEDGHWKCILFSNMYFCGTLRERELQLCFIPRPIFNAVNAIFGDRHFPLTGTNCSLCTAIFSILLIPLVLTLGILVLVIVIILAVAFMPFFVVTVLPCIIVLKCRKCCFKNDNIIKILDSDEGLPLSEKKNNSSDLSNISVSADLTVSLGDCTDV
ncbi:uncharacterized protein [Lepeophtheirus salmonis]|uniref:uncharacterized protein n=1 Tax=Lepeophtheirus salmonis TaxID=72036 RepID=UPI001AE45C30|nr:uncharacterized protein LOC121120814 [Lepeophtheirus salmonis]